ncbi:TKL protein kinase [Phytophthora nicotianae CJ01A1]|uniref:TKL protein kinase n=1 Tax=Phytophthora nicotianae CJ01A1 TaxID=1317063 RepID=W2WVU0_PHYNI|nr:TKL protein kinase [Phytophthora nicotianae CJ01A1]
MAPMTRPTGSAWLTTWLKDEFAVEDLGFEELLLIPVILVVIAAMGIGWFCWKRSSCSRENRLLLAILTWFSKLLGCRYSRTSSSTDGDDYELRQHLHGNRIPYDSLVFQTELSKGASGEVWICRYGGQEVAVKKLLHIRDQKAEDVQIFAEEIELTASLIHPHIVKFIGRESEGLFTHKLRHLIVGERSDFMAIAVAEALEYLHSQSLDPKLIDFGVSRGMMDLTMTAGVGTPYWTTPENMEGDRYTDKADIYSFGVVLSELDTGRIPHFDAVEDDGTRLMPFQILQEVMTGTLRPSFSVDCPTRIQRIGVACLSFEPSDRPTAQELIQLLEGKYSETF